MSGHNHPQLKAFCFCALYCYAIGWVKVEPGGRSRVTPSPPPEMVVSTIGLKGCFQISVGEMRPYTELREKCFQSIKRYNTTARIYYNLNLIIHLI